MGLRARIEPILVKAWLQRGVLACCLYPLSLLVRGLVRVRQFLYGVGLLQTNKVDACVIVVGNIVAGGAGKTPTVINLIQHFQAQGLHCGVISRGYGGRVIQPTEVQPHSDAQQVGDEPLLIYRKTRAPVLVGASRVELARRLLDLYPKTNVIVCDDGLQHYSLYRDIEVCVFDSRGCGNGWCIPAGPLRESWPIRRTPRVGQRDNNLLVLHTGKQQFAGFAANRFLGETVINGNGQTCPLNQVQEKSHKPLMALAGIAQPENFFALLRQAGLALDSTLTLPDHATFSDLSPDLIEKYQILCTEKDAVKLWLTVPQAWSVALIQEPEADFFKALDAALKQTLKQ